MWHVPVIWNTSFLFVIWLFTTRAIVSNLRVSLEYDMGWLRLVASLNLQVSFAEYRLFYRALLQKRPMILRSLLIVAIPYHFFMCDVWRSHVTYEKVMSRMKESWSVKELHHIWWNMTLSYGTWLLCTWHDSLIRLSCAWHDFPPFLARLHHVWHDSFISHMDGLKDTWLGTRMESWYGKFKSDMKENIVSFIGLFCKRDLWF